MNNLGLKLLGVTAIAALMLPVSALALDARDFADKLSATLRTAGGFEINFTEVSSEGDSITLGGWDIPSLPQNGAAEKILAGAITFTGVIETAEGGYEAAFANFDDVDIIEEGIRLEIRNLRATGIELFSDPTASILNTMLLYKGILAGPITASMDGKEFFSVADITSGFEANEDKTEFTGSYAITGIYGDVSEVDDAELEEMFEVFELSEINASMRGEYFWRIEDGAMSFNDSIISIEDVGSLSFDVGLLGYTLDLVQQLQDANQGMLGIDPTSAEAELKSIQLLMSMVAGLSLTDAAIRFDDDSVTNKVLDFIAEEEGLSRKGLISSIVGILPEMVGPLGIPDLQAKISDALVTFLLDPQNIEISATPAEPVPFLALMAVSQNPSIANELLNIDVKANQE